MSAQDKPRYSLRSLFLVVTVFGVWLGIVMALSPHIRSREASSLALSTLPVAFLLYGAYDARGDRGASVGILALATMYATIVAVAVWRSWTG